MSCHEIMSKLSAYVDGEVRDQDAGSIKTHITSCTSCSSELKQLQNTAKILCAVPDIEPPAFLLEKIRSATVNRKSESSGILARLSAALISSRYAQVAASVVAAAAITIVFVMSSPDTDQQTVSRPVVAKSMTAKDQPVPEVKPVNIASSVNKSPAEVVKELSAKQPIILYKRASYRYNRNRNINNHQTEMAGRNIKTPGNTGVKNIASADVKHTVITDLQPKPVATVDSVIVNQPILAPVKTETVAPAAVTESPDPVVNKVKVARMLSDEHEGRLGEETSAQKEMREKLAARNMQRRYTNYYPEHLDGKTISVDIASLRF